MGTSPCDILSPNPTLIMRSLTNPNWGTICFPGSSAGKEPTCNSGDLGWIPGLGRSPGEGKGYPVQYSGLENFIDCIVHGVAELDTTEWLSLSFCQMPNQYLPKCESFFFLFTLLYVFIYSFIHLFLAMLRLHCCMWTFCSCRE